MFVYEYKYIYTELQTRISNMLILTKGYILKQEFVFHRISYDVVFWIAFLGSKPWKIHALEIYNDPRKDQKGSGKG